MRDTRAGITDVNDEVFADEYVGVAGRDIVVSFSSVMMMREVNVYGQHSKKLFLYFIDSHVCPLIASVATLATSIADRWHNAHSFHRPEQADYGVVFNLTYVVRLNPRTTTTTSPGQQLRSDIRRIPLESSAGTDKPRTTTALRIQRPTQRYCVECVLRV